MVQAWQRLDEGGWDGDAKQLDVHATLHRALRRRKRMVHLRQEWVVGGAADAAQTTRGLLHHKEGGVDPTSGSTVSPGTAEGVA